MTVPSHIFIYTNCLVYVFIGENWALLDFIDIMNDRNLLSTGEYVVLAIDNSIDDVSDNQVGFSHNYVVYIISVCYIYGIKRIRNDLNAGLTKA